MKTDMKSYGINDIESLSFKDGCRLRISMYLGTDDNEGTYQALKEILNNSTDEALAGFGNRIEIKLDESSNTISVRDYGRGVPFGIRPDGENVLVSIYTKSHTGGKFQEGAYKNASGLNGVGGSCVCLSSKMFVVQSYRDGKAAEARFKQGDLVNYEEYSTKEKNGTFVMFSPDPEVFHNGEIGYSYDRICQDIKDISYLYNDITFEVSNGKKKQSFHAANGIKDFIKDNLKKPLHPNILYNTITDGDDKMEIAFQWGSKKEEGYVFVNGLRCPEGGSPITGARAAITRTFNSLAGTDIDGELIRDNLFYVINCTVAHPSFANQTKSKINNANLRTMASNCFSDTLKIMQLKYRSDFDNVLELLKKVAKADAAAERARQSILNHEKEFAELSKKKIVNADKLRDARKLGQDSILLVTEGLSAGGSMSIGRDPNKYGILMLRGKAKNLLNCPIEEGLENEEVKLMLQALGLVYGKGYNGNKLRYGKVAIAVDSDFDGSHIGLLVMSMLDVLCPQLLKEGRLYWLKAPIYKVETKKKNYYYYTEEEFAKHPEGNIIKYKGNEEVWPLRILPFINGVAFILRLTRQSLVG